MHMTISKRFLEQLVSLQKDITTFAVILVFSTLDTYSCREPITSSLSIDESIAHDDVSSGVGSVRLQFIPLLSKRRAVSQTKVDLIV
jgi:hypothetical protein